jgi:hypothetical protein
MLAVFGLFIPGFRIVAAAAGSTITYNNQRLKVFSFLFIYLFSINKVFTYN